MLLSVTLTLSRREPPWNAVPAGAGCVHGALDGFGGGRTRTVAVSAALSATPSLTTSVNTRSVRTEGAVNDGAVVVAPAQRHRLPAGLLPAVAERRARPRRRPRPRQRHTRAGPDLLVFPRVCRRDPPSGVDHRPVGESRQLALEDVPQRLRAGLGVGEQARLARGRRRGEGERQGLAVDRHAGRGLGGPGQRHREAALRGDGVLVQGRAESQLHRGPVHRRAVAGERGERKVRHHDVVRCGKPAIFSIRPRTPLASHSHVEPDHPRSNGQGGAAVIRRLVNGRPD